MSEPESMVERLARKWASTWPEFAGKDLLVARWWLRAVAEELEEDGYGGHKEAIEQLREEADR